MKALSRLLFCLSLICFIAAYMDDTLPKADQIIHETTKEPIQTPTSKAKFTTEVGGLSYEVAPLFSYELYGVVVSTRDHTGIRGKRSHRRYGDNINVADICVIWGNNAKSDNYTKVKYSSGDFFCFTYPNSYEVYKQFDRYSLSNNHLITDSTKISDAINSARIGDQIYFKGYLSTYARSDGSYRRGTSTVRTDTGDGACETVYVEEFKVVAKRNNRWLLLAILGGVFLITALVIWLKVPLSKMT